MQLLLKLEENSTFLTIGRSSHREKSRKTHESHDKTSNQIHVSKISHFMSQTHVQKVNQCKL